MVGSNEGEIGCFVGGLVWKGVGETYRMFTSRAEYRILLRQDDADMRLTEKSYKLGLASEERYNRMLSKREQRDKLVEFCKEFSIKPALINDDLVKLGTSPLKEGCKLHALVLRPQLDINKLAEVIVPLKNFLNTLENERREEIIEAAEILIKYQGYIDREKMIAEKVMRLEHVKLKGKLKYSEILAISTEARQKLEKIDPETVAQAARIPGISPSDINILLLLLGR